VVQGWRRSLVPLPGVVHFNIPLREPLAPTLQGETRSLESHAARDSVRRFQFFKKLYEEATALEEELI
ncbi:MAG: 2-succinyl-5-enolpyruvyl-6-hydroxy-3-cyclohexene-1-carboxylic-acid synthase, partial [Pseudomonadota bacterium]|nr:2-succinyl-5-enolpyruvyl-6-hydroxy-3-cyclohexene-1-carboxylic-acid synthase [Pseudomonadota bacterium]